jgi:branched-chain amino acid transport system substrate-binding protein
MKRSLLAILAILVVVAGSCSNSPSSTPSSGSSSEPIKIGALLELTGVGTTYGLQAKDMIEMALDEYGRKIGDHPIEVVYADDATDPATALTKAKQLVERDGVDVIFGPNFSDAQDAIASYLGSQKIVALGPIGANWSLSEQGNWVVYPGTLESFCAPSGKWLFDQGSATMSTLGADYVAGHQLVDPIADGFKGAGGEVVQQQWAPLGTADFGSYISSLEPSDVFAAWTIMPDELALIDAFLKFKKDTSTNMFLCEADNVTNDQLTQFGADIVGTTGMISSYSPDIQNAANEKFIAAVNEKYGRVPTIEDGGAYISMVALLEGLKKTGGDAALDVLRPAILALQLDTPAGPVSYTSNGFALSNRYLVEVAAENGSNTWQTKETFTDVRDPRDSG